MSQNAAETSSPAVQAAKLRGILESAVTAIITIDHRGLIETVNPATERLFGYGAAELIGQNVKVLMPQPYRAEHDGYIANYAGTGVKKIIGIGREVSGRRKDGTTFPLHLSVSEFEAEGRRYFTGMIHDISDRQHVEDALRRAALGAAGVEPDGDLGHGPKVASYNAMARTAGSRAATAATTRSCTESGCPVPSTVTSKPWLSSHTSSGPDCSS